MHDDVRKALEMAAEASASIYDVEALKMTPRYQPQGACDVDRAAARAAVLAFVKAMPEYRDVDGLRVQWDIPDIAAELAKEGGK